jgi:hypothetical protein
MKKKFAMEPKVKLKLGQIVVEQPVCGIIFSFPAHCWPDELAHQRMWVDRLTPWWDMEQPQWSPTSHRLREKCLTAINNLLARIPLNDCLPTGSRSASEVALASAPENVISTQLHGVKG